jgi:hypothetical protein
LVLIRLLLFMMFSMKKHDTLPYNAIGCEPKLHI